MVKNRKGKECGKGICQRKDGKFSARYSAKNGARREKHFDTLPEARNWLADAQYEDKHDVYNPSSEMTVDAWFEFWITKQLPNHSPDEPGIRCAEILLRGAAHLCHSRD